MTLVVKSLSNGVMRDRADRDESRNRRDARIEAGSRSDRSTSHRERREGIRPRPGAARRLAGDRRGELFALLGPSGSGKTTLLRILAGLEIPTAGACPSATRMRSPSRVQERNVGFVFQHYALFRHMTVLDNIAFGLNVRPARAARRRRDPRARAAICSTSCTLGLEKRYPQPALRRPAPARRARPRARDRAAVLLLDEPFGALDAQVRRELRRWLREIHDKNRPHHRFRHPRPGGGAGARRPRRGDEPGPIEQVGTPDEIYDPPDSPFVFDFIGESSDLPCGSNAATLFSTRYRCRLPRKAVPTDRRGCSSAPRMSSSTHSDRPGAISGTIAAIRRHGGARRLDVEAGRDGHRIEIELPSQFEGGVGEEVAVLPRRWRLYPVAASGV